MDPVTHLLFGATLSRTGLNRKTGLATATLVLSAELPDVDVFVSFFNRITGFAVHRGFTHTLLGAPVMAACTLGIIYGFHRWRLKRGHNPLIPVNWKLLYIYALIGSLSHILLDFTNDYGVRPFAPFSYRWYSWDIVYIIEPLMVIALMLALVAPWFFGLISGEIGARRPKMPGRGCAIAALVFIALLWWVRDYNHRRAVTLLQANVYENADAIRVHAGPNMIDPFSWRGIVETETFYQSLPVDTLKGEVDPKRQAVTRYKPEENPFSLATKKSRLGRIYLDWARWSYTETQLTEQGGAEVTMRDLRFILPNASGNQRSVLSVTIDVDRSLNVTEQFVGRPVRHD